MYVNKNPEYFLTVAAEHSFSRAAEKLYVSQPYLSQHIRHLEERFGVRLLDRSRTPLELTAAGRLYAHYLESLNRLDHKLLADFDALSSGREQTLRVGLSNWRAGALLPDIFPIFMERCPHVRPEFIESTTDELYRLAESGEIDFAVLNASPGAPEGITTETILYERILLVRHRKNAAALELLRQQAAGEPLDLHLLESERVLLMQPKIVIAERIRNFLDQQQLVLRNVAYCTNTMTALSLTARNCGFCFVNETGIRSAPERDALVFFDLATPDMIHPLCVVYSKSSYLRPAARTFIDVMSEFYRLSDAALFDNDEAENRMLP